MSNSNLIDENNIPDNLQAINAPKIVPGSPTVPAPIPHDMPQFFSGSMPPALQHDTSFVSTEVGSPRIPKHSLMPFGVQGSPSSNAGIQSTVIKVVNSSGGSGIELDTNGSPNPNQKILNLVSGANIGITADPSGAVTIAGTGGSDSRFISRPDYKRPAYWLQSQPVGGTVGAAGIFSAGDVNPVKTTVAGFTDAIVGPSSVDMPGWNFTNGGGSPSTGDYRILWGADLGVFGRDFTFIATANIVAGLGSGRYWFAVADGGVANRFLLVFNNADNPGTINTIGFLYSPTSVNWRAVACNGSAATNADTGVAVALNTAVQLRIDWTASSNTAVFTIDGTVVATITTNTPSAATVYGMVQGVRGTNTTGVGYSAYSMYCASSYPFSNLILS